MEIIQLVNGENIIGNVVDSDNDEVITIHHPMSLMLDPMSGGLGMIPYLSLFTGALLEYKEFAKKHVITVLESDEISKEIVERYNEYKNQVLNDVKKPGEHPNQGTLPEIDV